MTNNPSCERRLKDFESQDYSSQIQSLVHTKVFHLHGQSSLQHNQIMSTNKVLVLCRFGGDFIWESNKVYYKGGTNRIVRVDRAIDYLNILSKVRGICKLTDISSINYKYPGLDLDSLVSIENDDDVSNMMEAFPQSSEPIQLFVFCDQNLSVPISIPSNLMQNANNDNVPALLRDLHGSNGAPAPSLHNTNANDNDVPSASSDLHELGCYHELPRGVVDSCVNDIPKIMSVLKEGQEFEDANAFHQALREYAISLNFEYKRTKSGRGLYQAKCIKDNCSWRIHACKLPDKPTLKIKSLKGDHTCNFVNESAMSTTKMHQQDLVKDGLQKKLCCTPKDIVDEISQEYGIKVSYDKAWRGKELVIKEGHFITTLMEICEEIQRTNPGSRAKLSRSSDNSLRVFVAYKAAIHGFKQACRPLVRLDCMKMEGKCRGVWLFAMAIDAEEDVFPVSCAFVESKNVGSWKWFCGELAQVLESISKLTFISDRQEGILEVVSDIFPDACHRYSRLRLIEEFSRKFNCLVNDIFPDKCHSSQFSLVEEITPKSNCLDLYWLFRSAVYGGDHSEFDACMREIHDKYKEAWNFVKDINPKHWATSHFEEKLSVYDYFYLNAVRHWWDKLEGWKDVSISGALVNLHVYMMEIFNEEFKISSNWETIFVPGVEGFIYLAEMIMVEKRNFSVSGGAAEFEVLYVSNENKYTWKVDLERGTCSCHVWQTVGHPCAHAVAAIRYSGRNVYDYIDGYYRVEKYKETYSEVIHPLHLPNTSTQAPKPTDEENIC